jgi:hypothetical protein
VGSALWVVFYKDTVANGSWACSLALSFCPLDEWRFFKEVPWRHNRTLRPGRREIPRQYVFVSPM